MNAIAQQLTDDYRHCKALFAKAEGAVATGDWVTAQTGFEGFRRAVHRSPNPGPRRVP